MWSHLFLKKEKNHAGPWGPDFNTPALQEKAQWYLPCESGRVETCTKMIKVTWWSKDLWGFNLQWVKGKDFDHKASSTLFDLYYYHFALHALPCRLLCRLDITWHFVNSFWPAAHPGSCWLNSGLSLLLNTGIEYSATSSFHRDWPSFWVSRKLL